MGRRDEMEEGFGCCSILFKLEDSVTLPLHVIVHREESVVKEKEREKISMDPVLGPLPLQSL